MLSIFKPAPHKARLPAAEIDPTYRRLRWQIFLGIFFGYAAYYLVRKNFALAMPYLVEQGFSRGDVEHCGDVCTVVPLRLVPGDGVAAVWSYYGALVVAERTWRHCVSVELCAQRRWWYSAAAVPAGDGLVQ